MPRSGILEFEEIIITLPGRQSHRNEYIEWMDKLEARWITPGRRIAVRGGIGGHCLRHLGNIG